MRFHFQLKENLTFEVRNLTMHENHFLLASPLLIGAAHVFMNIIKSPFNVFCKLKVDFNALE